MVGEKLNEELRRIVIGESRIRSKEEYRYEKAERRIKKNSGRRKQNEEYRRAK